MQWSRVKTILIITLLLVDGFLIAMLGGKALFVYQRQQEMRQHVEMILLKNGITLASSMKIPRSAPMPQLRVDRSRADEAALANALLGGDATRREEGEESHFESTSGEVVWNERGEIHARLTPEGYSMPETKQVGARAAQILQAAGLYMPDVVWKTGEDTATVCARLAGYDIFNQTLTILFSKKGIRITGCWTFDTPYSTKSDVYTSYSAADALVLFAQHGPVSQIQGMEPGLLLTNGSTNYSQISPTWKIYTEQGIFFIDPLKKVVS